MVTNGLQGRSMEELGARIGTDRDQTERAVAAALPMLLGALNRNAQSADGASALSAALDRDHDGSVLDDLVGFLGKNPELEGNGILKHALGDRRDTAVNTVSGVSGMDAASAGKLMAMLAPLVMGALGRQKRSSKLDPGGLAEMLGAERKKAPGDAGAAMDLVSKMLDRDGDGQVLDDLAGGLLKGFLGKR